MKGQEAGFAGRNPMDRAPTRPGGASEGGLPPSEPHDLRHFAATQLLAGGQDVRTVAGRLGHADASVTLGTYAHFLAVADRRAADLLGGLLDRLDS
jgi:integrase